MHIGVLGPMSLELLPLENPCELTGLASYSAPIISSIVREYLASGARVTAVTTSTSLDETITVVSGALTVAVVPRDRPRSALRAFRTERRSIVRALEFDPPDILHAHWTYEFAAAAQDTGLPALITAHDDSRVVFRFQPTLYRFLRLILSDRVLNRASCVSAPSKYLASRVGPRASGHVLVIPNFLDDEVLSRTPVSAERAKTIITVSNGFTGWKNVATALRGFAASRVVESGWEYRLVGHGMEAGGEAEQWAKAKGLGRGVVFEGALSYPETLDAIQQASVMLHPSLEESFGMTVLEAMALGTPVIGGVHSGNVPALLSDGCGALCDVESAPSIASMLNGLLADPRERELIAARAGVRASSDYSMDRVVGKYMDVLSAILAGRQSTEDGV